MNSRETSTDPTDSWKIFDRIAHRYDLLNRTLSLGQDMAWRRRMRRYLPDGASLEVLDLATGTADQLIYLARDGRVASGLGMDLSEKMLEVGREKVARLGLTNRLRLETGDATAIPLASESVDVASISFGIRNVVDVGAALSEMYRVLRPGGRALILEFSLPRFGPLRWVYLKYFRHVLPRVGGWLSGDAQAYRYLNQSVEAFPYGAAFCALMEAAGFSEVSARSLTFGIATIYRGDRPA